MQLLIFTLYYGGFGQIKNSNSVLRFGKYIALLQFFLQNSRQCETA